MCLAMALLAVSCAGDVTECRRNGMDTSTCAAVPLSEAPAMLQRRSTVQHVALRGDGCCEPFSKWPHVDGNVTCDDCTALVLAKPYGNRCDKYCESFGHVCVLAAEDFHQDCRVKHMVACDEPINGTSDILCKCRLPDAQHCEPTPPVKPSTPPPTHPPHTGKRIQVRGRQVLVDGKPIHLKGVAWNPIPQGGRHPQNLDFASVVAQDAELLARAGVNIVRTYEPITDLVVLDKLWEHKIWVMNGLYNWGGASVDSVIGKVNSVKHHPALLMWSIGNEWNFNGLYVGMAYWDAVARLREVAKKVKSLDQEHPVACIYGEIGGIHDVAEHMPEVDVWGINAYRGISFGGLFDDYKGLMTKPLFLGEYGADAYNALAGSEDQESQAKATKALTEEIVEHSSITGGVCIGGFVFEFADEWWKDGAGSPAVHDVGGVAPGGGPYPDMTFNEEWWGLVGIDRTPRKAYWALRSVSIPSVEEQ